MVSVITFSVFLVSVIMLNVIAVIVIPLSVIVVSVISFSVMVVSLITSIIALSVTKVSDITPCVIMLCAIILHVVGPHQECLLSGLLTKKKVLLHWQQSVQIRLRQKKFIGTLEKIS